MTRRLGRCLAMTIAAFLLAVVFLAVGVPGAWLLALAPALLCVAMYLLIGHGLGDPDGRDLLKTARRAADRRISTDASAPRYAPTPDPARDGVRPGATR
jgi:hypothetical protein